ncbi:MAG: DciA family protein [Gemmatales bacterium]|nr:DUF721 domain-containing protein [Gemmatales bacterium]MDW7993991.1 DciA family protein [Gemmatales bacterium]
MSESHGDMAQELSGGPVPLAEAVAEVLWRRGLRHGRRRQHLEAAWRRAVPAEWADRLRLGSWRHGVLEVYTQDAALLHRLVHFDGPVLLRELQRELGTGQVTHIRFRLG